MPFSPTPKRLRSWPVEQEPTGRLDEINGGDSYPSISRTPKVPTGSRNPLEANYFLWNKKRSPL